MIADPNKYAPGTPIFNRIAETYGQTGAMRVYQAALTGVDGAVNDALGQLKYGDPLETSTWSIFLSQIYSDPLGAPLDQIGTIAQNTAKKFASNWGLWLVLLVVGGAVFFWLGGAEYLKRKLAKA